MTIHGIGIFGELGDNRGMCGRAYETYTDEELALRYLSKRPIRLPDFKPNYNLAPTQLSPVVVTAEGARQLDLFTWGLIPPWEAEFKTKLSTINAKSETVFESRLYKGSILKHRLIVPLSGFIEWQRDGSKKRPFAIHHKDQAIMSVAGVWSTWQQGDFPARHSFSILTTAANPFMKEIHDRMPVILAPEDESPWLDPGLQDPVAIKKMLKPCPSAWLSAFEISPMVNSPRNNRPEVLLPFTEPQGALGLK